MSTNKSIFVFLLCLFLSPDVFGQDKIYTIKGEVIDAKVIDASAIRIMYLQYSGSDTLKRRIGSNAVESIHYADGHETQFAHSKAHTKQLEEKQAKKRTRYVPVGYKNIITLHAPHLEVVHGLPAMNVGIEYERFLDKKGYFSVFLPLYPERKLDEYFGRFGGIHSDEILESGKTFYIGPGAYFHPLGNTHRVDIGIGLQYTAGTFESKRVKYNSLNTVLDSSNFRISTLSANLNINFSSKGHFVYGCYSAYGMSLVSGRKNPALFELGFKLGVRF